MTIQILVAIANVDLRESLQVLLEKHNGIALMNWDTRQDLYFSVKPLSDVLLMDLDMPWIKGIEMIGKILLSAPAVKLLALSMHANRQIADEVIRAGASGYILKDRAYEDLFPAIRAVVAGRIYQSPGTGDGYASCDSDAPVLPATVKKRTHLELKLPNRKETSNEHPIFKTKR